MVTMRQSKFFSRIQILGSSLVFILSFQLVGCQTNGGDNNAPELTETKKTKIERDQNSMIITAIENGNPEKRILIARQLMQTRGDDPTLHNLQGLCFMAVKNHVAAIDAFRKAYALKSDPSYALNLSSALIENGDHSKAIRLLKAMTKGKKGEEYLKKERIYHNLGYANVKSGKNSAAERWFRKALDANPSYFLSHMALGKLYEKTRRPAMARTSFRQASDFCAICFDPIEPLVNLYMQARQPQEATAVITRYLRNSKVRPEDKARANKLLMRVSRTAMHRGPRSNRTR